MGDQVFGLANVERLLEYAFGGEFLFFGAGQSQNHLRVAHREAAVADVNLEVRRQLEQPQSVGHHRSALADFGRRFLLPELELFDQLRVTVRLFNRIQVFTLQVLDQRQLEHRAVIRLAHDDRRFRQTKHLRGSPAPFSGDQLIVAAAQAHDERLNNALLFDRIGQFAEGLDRKVFAGLKWTGTNARERDA